MAIAIPASCGGSDSSEEKTEPKDTTAPVISIEQPEVDVSGGKYARVSGDYLYIGDGIAASWKDDSGKSCIAQLAYNGQDIGS